MRHRLSLAVLLPLTDAQERSIVDYVRNGKALVGVHCASLTLYDYPEFGEVLGGYYRRSSPTCRNSGS